MSITTTAKNIDGDPIEAEFDPPNRCPVCHCWSQPKFLTAIWSEEHQRIEAAFRCTRKRCQSMFIGAYSYPDSNNTKWQPRYVAAHSIAPPEYSEIVTTISPQFIEIMNQVVQAKAKQLNQLVGMGMRKALEFLMKDFVIWEHPNQRETIERGELAWVIGQYISDDHIRACAKRAAWLGNDETHYIRKWKDKDIRDLSDLVELTVRWIEYHELTKLYEQDMPEPERGRK